MEVDTALAPKLLDSDTIVFLAHIGPEGDSIHHQFQALATRYRDSYTFIMTGPMQGRSALYCFNNIDELQHTAEDFGSTMALEAFIKKCSSPLIPELTRANEAEYSQVTPVRLPLRLSRI